MNGSAAELGALRVYPTADGSFSLHSDHFGEAFHNSAGALNEAQAKALESQRKSDVKSMVLDHKSAGAKRMVGLSNLDLSSSRFL